MSDFISKLFGALPKQFLFALLAVIMLPWQVDAQCTDVSVSATDSNILCEGGTTITIPSTNSGGNYYLRDNADNSIIEGPIVGDGGGLSFNTGVLSSSKTFNVYMDNSSSSGAMLFEEVNSSYSTIAGYPWNAATTNDLSFTIEFWLKFNDNLGSNQGYINIMGHVGANGFIELTDAGFLYFRSANNTEVARTATGVYPMDGNYHHVAIVYDHTLASGSRNTIYIDGSQVSLTNNADLPVAYSATGTFEVGRHAGDSFYNLDGELDELRFWNTARSSTEISNNKDVSLVGNESGLVAYYAFEEGSGTTFSDITGNGYNGTLYNTTGANWVTRSGGSCTLEMTQTATVTIDPLTDLAVSATASNILCEGSTTITTPSSQSGVNYYLRDNADDALIDGPIAGTGSGLSLNTGTVSSTTTYNVFAQATGTSGALDFDGVDEYVSIPHHADLAPTGGLTVEVWAKGDEAIWGDFDAFISKRGTSEVYIISPIGGGTSVFFILGTTAGRPVISYDLGANGLATNEWHHYAMTYDGTTVEAFIDGVSVGTSAITGAVRNHSSPIDIARDNCCGARFFDGQIDEVRIWNQGRSMAEINGSMNSELVGNETGLIAYYDFEEGTGTTLTDRTVNGHNGTLINMENVDWTSRTANVCDLEMTQTATVTIDALTDQTYGVSATSVNEGGNVDFTINGSQSNVNYYLRNDTDNTVIAGPVAGTGSAIVINTGTLTESITFNVYQEHTSTNCSAEMTQGLQSITVIPVTRHYVDIDAVGANNGSSWADAFTDLQSALAVANAGDAVWVAAGTYLPTATTDRTIWFEPADGVEIYGGFAGTETDVSQRSNFGVGGANETILSGDIGTQGVDTDNSQHVFNFIANNATNTLNGLTIAKGYTNGGPIAGGGIYFSATAATLHLTDVHLVDNYAAWDGAGMVSYGSTNVYMTRVSFTGGYAGEEGGGFELNSSGIVKLNQVEVMSNQARWEGAGGRITASSDLTIINSKFVGNEMTTTSRPYGGGIEIVNVTGSIVNTIISGNKSMNFGGGIRMANSVLDIINCTIVANEATGNGGGISISGGTLNLKNTIIWDNEHNNIKGDQSASIYQEAAATINYTNSLVEAYNPGGTNLDGTNAGNDPLFTSAVDLSVTATPTTSGDFSIQNSSPAKDAGDNALLPADEFDLDGDSNTAETLPVDLVFNNRSTGAVDMGSYENLTSNQAPTLTAFSGAVDTGNEDEEIEITFTELQTSGDENDSDGTVDAFKVKSVATGTLKIGASSGAATVYAASTNDIINASLNAYWTPAADVNGTGVNIFEVVVVDNQGVESTTNVMATLDVTAVNDAPSFTKGADETVNEDAVAQTITGWATALNKGATNESGQTLSFNVSNDDNTLFSVQPSINASGDLSYTPAADANGIATVTVSISDDGGTANSGVDTSADQTFTITINSVNDAPSFTKGADETVNEDAVAQTIAGWATALNKGATNESGQILSFNVSNDDNTLFSVQPSINASGDLSYTPAADANGIATVTVSISDDGGTANGGVGTSADQTFTITINSVNDAPSFTKGADETVNEDAVAQTIAGWATALNKGATNESGQTLSFNVSNDDNTLFSVQPSINASGDLSYTPAADANGIATVTVSISDDGGTANGGVGTSADQTFTITINSVNDAPSFTKGADETVNEDAVAQTIAGWATALNKGATNESGQTLSFNVSNDDNTLFSVQPSINASGDLSYTPAADANGIATVTVSISDDGGTANGGVDTSADQTFTITINSVNDAPSFTKGADETVNEDAVAQTIAGWATALNKGATNESGQTLSFNVSNDDNTLFSVQPSINASGDLSYTPAADANGIATVTVSISDDGGTANGGVGTSADQTFTITINSVNDAPSFTKGADETVNEDAVAQTITGWATALNKGATNESAQTLSFAVSNDDNTLFSVQPTINSSGDLSYTPTADASGSATVTVSISDDGGTANGGVDTSADQTFTITINSVNDGPSVDVNNGLTLDEGATLVITTSELSASDVDNISSELTYTVTTSPVNGIVVRSSDTNSAITSFTQSEVEANEILYKHDDSETISDSFVFTIADNAGGSASGVTFNITINPVDDTAPVISSLSPLDGATGVASVGGSFEITFSENIFKGTGVISFKRTNDNSLVGTVMVSSGNVSITGATASITTSFNRGCDEDIYIEIGNGVFVDGNSNDFAGLAPAAWNFVTNEAPVIIPGSIIVTDNTSCDVTKNGALDASNAIQLDGGASAAGNYTFQWYEGAGTGGASAGTTASISALTSGSYTLVVTHTARGCESDAVTVTLNDDFTDPPIINPTVSALTDCASDNGSVSATASSTSEPTDYTFKLYEGVGTGGTVLTNLVAAGNVGFTTSSLASGSYTIEAINNSTSCNATQTVTVNDDRVLPTINATNVAQSNLTECGTGDGSIDISAAIEESSVVQDPADFTITWYAGSGTGGTVVGSTAAVSNLTDGVYTVEVVRNSNSCSVSAEYTLVEDDQINPTVITQDITVQLDAAGAATIATTDIDNGSSDACGILSQSLDVTAFDCSHIGTPQTVTLTVTDNNGNVNTATATVTVEDSVLPTVVTQDITVQLDASGAATIATTDIDNGSSDACGILSQSLDVTAFDCSHVGTPQTVTLTVTDNNGNSSTGTATVTVEDSVLPTVVTQDITIQLDAAGAATIATTDIDNGSSDACGILSQSLDVTAFDCSHIGTPQTVTLTVTDNNGNVNTATATVTVEDSVLPTVVTQDITLQLDAAGAATIATTDIDNGSSDACGILSQSLDVTAFDCSHVGTPQTVTLTLTDNNGNVNTATATVTVEDSVLPTVVAQDITVQLDAAGAATIATTDIDNGSSDACGILSQSLDVTAFDCSHIGTPQTVTLTVTDNNGNVNTATATVTVEESVLPMVVTQDITVQLDAAGAATIATTDIDNGSSDACGILSQSLDVTSFDCSHVGTPQTVTLTVTDNNGNVNTSTATVTVEESVLPTVVTQDITVQLDAAGSATIATTDIDNGSSDACGILSQSLDVTAFDCSHIGTPQTVTLTVTDNNGNVNTATATVTVEDSVLPTVVTQDITVQLDAAGSATIATTDIDNGSSDACGILSQSLDVTSFDCSHVGTPQTVTLTVTDNNGNSSTGTATVTVEDSVLPTVVTQDITIQLDAAGAATIATTDIDNGSSDACGILSQSLDVTAFDCSHIGTPQTVTLTVTDNNGNVNTATATVTVEDSVLPTVVTQDITLQLDAAGAATIATTDIDNGSSDACGILSQSLDVTAFDCSHVGTPQTVTLTVTDNNGNSSTGTATVTVEDSVLPTVVTQDITLQLDAAGAATIATTDIDNGSSDACGILSQSLDVTAFDCSHVGTPQTVTLTVTDNNGNSSTGTATVTVEDSVLPTVVTQDITVQLDAAGSATIATTDIDNGSSDACGILSQSLDVTAFDCSHVGTPQTVTLTVTDNNGNVNTATATVTVEDSVLPTVVTQDITVQLDAAGAATIATTDIDNGSSDACGILSQSLDVTAFDCSHVGTPQTVTLTVTGNNGNVNTATATVTVEDSVLPNVVTQDITVQLDAAGSATIATTDIDNGSSDACGILSQSLDVTAFDCSHVGTPQTVTLTVTDNNGNSSTGTATVTVEDSVLPTVVTQDITVQLDAAGAATIATTDIDNGSSDACGILSQSLDVTAFDCSHIGTPQTVTLTVTDNNGNVNTATATVTVEESVLPMVVTQDITVQLDAAGAATIATTDIDNGSSDACGILSQSLDVTSFDCSHVGTPQTVTLTVTDNNGNVNTSTATVTVEESVLPTVVTQDITVQLDAAGSATIATTDIDNGSSDACGILSQSLDVTAFDCSHVGTPQTVTLTVTDNNGNSNTGTATVTVEDVTAPVFTVQNTTVVLDATGNGLIGVDDVVTSQEDCLTLTLSRTIFDCADTEKVEIEVIGVDAGGNETIKTVVVTVDDSTAKPKFNIVSDANIQCDGGSVTLLPVHAVSGSAIRFGTGGHTVTNHAAELNMNKTSAFTIEAWIRPERAQRGTILSKMLTNAPYTGYELFYENGRIGYHLIQHWTGSTIDGRTNTNIAPGQWHHVAMVYDGNSVTLYVNGTKVSQRLFYNRLNGSMANSVGLFLGTRGGTQFPFVGSMDEVRLWDHARSASQISKLKDARIDRNFGGLLAYYDFENVTDSEILDKSIWAHTMMPKGNFSIVDRSEMAIDTVNYSYEFDGSIAQSASNSAASFENKNYISFKNSTLNAGAIGSIEMRVKWNGIQDQGYGRLFGAIFGRQRNGAYSNAILGLNHQDPNQARLVWRPYNGIQNIITSSVTLDNNWHHVVITFGNGSHKMYIDGVLVGSANINGRFRRDPNTPFTLGAWSGHGDSYSTTSIDDLRIWKIALDDSQINEVLNDFNLASQNKNLGLYYDFESYSGNLLVTDKSGSEAPGKVVGGLSMVDREVPVGVQSGLVASYNLSIAQQGYQRIKVINKETGCAAIDSIYIDLGSNPKPLIRPLRNPLYCGENANVPLAISSDGGQGVLSIQWYRNGYKIEEAVSSTYVATTAGNYAVEITNSLGCPGLSDAIEVRSSQPKGEIEGDFRQMMCGNSHIFTVKNEDGVLFRLQWYDHRYRRWVNYGRVSQSNELEARHVGYYRVVIRSVAGCITYTPHKQLLKGRQYHSYISDMNGRAFPQEVQNGTRQGVAFVGQRMRTYYRYSSSQVDYTWIRDGEIVGEGYDYTSEAEGTHVLVITDKSSGCEFKSAIVEVYKGPQVMIRNLSQSTEICGNSIRLRAEFDVAPDQWKYIRWSWYINGREYRNPKTELVVTNPGSYQILIRYKGQPITSNIIRITNSFIRTYPDVSHISYCPGKPFINGKISDRFKEINIDKQSTYYWYSYQRGRWVLIGQNMTGELEVRRSGYYGFRAITKCGTVSRFVSRPVRMNYCGRWRKVELPSDTTVTEALPSVADVDLIEVYSEQETLVHVEMSPQPAADLANIKIVYSTDELAEDVKIKLFDLTGRLLTTRPLNDVNSGYSETSINVSDLSDGVYLFSIESAAGNIHSGRFIITR